MLSNSAKVSSVSDADVIHNNDGPAEIRAETETIGYTQELPPPYTVSGAVEHYPPPVVHQTVIIKQPLKHHSVIYTCDACGNTVLTKVRHVNTRRTHMCAGFLCGCALWCMLCCIAAIPYAMPICKNAEHYCPNCDNFIGDYSKV